MGVQVRRVGAIGDVHAEDAALESALRFFENEELDRILCVGDIADGPGDFSRCCRLLDDPAIDLVRGNHDRWLIAGEMRSLPDSTEAATEEERAWLSALPATRSYQTPHGELMLCHGIGSSDMNRVGPDDDGYALEANFELQDLLMTKRYRFVINGHTHRRMARKLGGTTIINVGTLFRDHDPCVAIIDFDSLRSTFYEIEGGQVTDRTMSVAL